MPPSRLKGFGSASRHGNRPCQAKPTNCAALGLILLVALLVSGCSSFQREWQRAAQSSTPTHSPAGCWEGRWQSDVNQHSGKLRCVLVPQSATNCVAYFHATYWKFFRASYSVSLAVAMAADVWSFHGEEDLGWLAGGKYRYAGQVSATNFFSTYESRYDHGTFQLQRPVSPSS